MPRKFNILLIEDNEGDVILTLEALKEQHADEHVSVISDGLEALQFLRQEGRYADAAIPDLILLDINLPKVDGKEVLASIKSDEKLKMIPVIMLTSSAAKKDIIDSYNMHANCFVTKPVNLHAFTEVIRSIEDFWLKTAQLPHN